jgi:hypothetical protein
MVPKSHLNKKRKPNGRMLGVQSTIAPVHYYGPGCTAVQEEELYWNPCCMLFTIINGDADKFSNDHITHPPLL